jgi:hypothetical protein
MPDSTANLKTNCLFQNGNNQPPTFSNGKSSFIFEHSEYITDIVTSSTIGAFKSETYVINPANSASFPLLANMATNFESYEILGMVYRYESTSGMAISGTNASIGTVMGYVAYDTLDNALISKAQLLQYEGSVDARMDKNFLVGVECDPAQLVMPKLYVGSPPVGADPKTYNHGNFVIATQGSQAASVTVGELYCHYKIRFHYIKQQSIASSLHLYQSAVPNSTVFVVSPTVISGALSAIPTLSTSLAVSNLCVGTQYTYTMLAHNASAITLGSPTFSVSGATLVAKSRGSTSTYIYVGSGTNDVTLTAYFVANLPTVTFTVSPGWTYTGNANIDTYINVFDNITL